MKVLPNLGGKTSQVTLLAPQVSMAENSAKFYLNSSYFWAGKVQSFSKQFYSKSLPPFSNRQRQTERKDEFTSPIMATQNSAYLKSVQTWSLKCKEHLCAQTTSQTALPNLSFISSPALKSSFNSEVKSHVVWKPSS